MLFNVMMLIGVAIAKKTQDFDLYDPTAQAEPSSDMNDAPEPDSGARQSK